MSLMSNININENPTKPELYNKIFAAEGGIFDKFYKDGIDYSNGAQIFRNSENISKYLTFYKMWRLQCLIKIAYLYIQKIVKSQY